MLGSFNCRGDKIRLRFKKLINQYRDQLNSLKKVRSANLDYQILEIKHNLEMVLIQEETFWKQRAKVFWLKDGDANTKFFHNYASRSRRKNTIRHRLKTFLVISMDAVKVFTNLFLLTFRSHIRQTAILIKLMLFRFPSVLAMNKTKLCCKVLMKMK